MLLEGFDFYFHILCILSLFSFHVESNYKSLLKKPLDSLLEIVDKLIYKTWVGSVLPVLGSDSNQP